ncbi:DEAD/DEAH box helicase [Sporolactobacillus inulinus]|uniref:Competence protein n=1 Tax=Sporolactobacillus inulinus CASD TaxID=1069536 RepID=A0A0U1QRX7_9BACL|nr:helicase-related protein [Sporolactobacillus inulinus]KLI03426.1 competence protein [Sporolactobacillus inulinus CASD]GEB77208.1 ComF operon protein 1 [Sporolactobacillus inulinus]
MLLLSRHLDQAPNYRADVQHFLFGREFRAEDLPFSEKLIRAHVKNGFISLRPGIMPLNENIFDLLGIRKKWLCARCGNRDQEAFAFCSCARCGKKCVYCRHCLNMGIVRSCTQLVTWQGPEPGFDRAFLDGRPLCKWDGVLSNEQQAAATAMKRTLAARESFLMWAVTGSGKTEIMYPAIEGQLRQGHHVALATPRTDVVRELLPRLRAAFPDVPISGLYGGSEEENLRAPLVISTAHQLIRYAGRFDCVFIDEVDAFPFHFDPMLEYAVHKAAKPGTPFAYLSATPPSELKNRFLSGSLKGVKLARRYHGHPLPIPRFRWIGSWQKLVQRGKLPSVLHEWLKNKMEAQQQVFVFVPSVSTAAALTELLQRNGFSRSAGVHSEDPLRHQKVADFRSGKLRLLVTTTILERGVTIANVQVGVVGADDPIFDEAALVQISGRVGRSAAYPNGDVVFFHNGKTLSMVRAVRHMVQMNQEGDR